MNLHLAQELVTNLLQELNDPEPGADQAFGWGIYHTVNLLLTSAALAKYEVERQYWVGLAQVAIETAPLMVPPELRQALR